jgi:hypothetical protein
MESSVVNQWIAARIERDDRTIAGTIFCMRDFSKEKLVFGMLDDVLESSLVKCLEYGSDPELLELLSIDSRRSTPYPD